MSDEFLPVLSLLHFCEKIYGTTNLDIDISIKNLSNSRLVFMPMGNNIFSVERSISSTYQLVGQHITEIKINQVDNLNVMGLMQGIVEAFIADSPSSKTPFLKIDSSEQVIALDYIRRYLK
jgi:hypothetical protein